MCFSIVLTPLILFCLETLSPCSQKQHRKHELVTKTKQEVTKIMLNRKAFFLSINSKETNFRSDMAH